MKILYLLPAVTHPTMRGELRHYHFLRQLSQRHEISVVALSRTPITSDAMDELRSSARRVSISSVDVPERNGAQAWRRRYEKRRRVHEAFARMRDELRQLVGSEAFDVGLVYGVDLEPVVSELRGLPVVADLCDAQSERIRQSLRFVSPIERAWQLASLWRTRRAERRLIRRAQHVTFVSGRDLDALPSAADHGGVIPNGVDAHYWSRSVPSVSAHRFVFTGVMDYGPNADAGLYLVNEILPRVRSVLPDATLTIAGRNPASGLRAAATRIGGVEVTGYMDDLRPALEDASVFAAPLRFASGTQNKILESMAMELPVVTSTVAAEGLRVSGAGAPPVLVADRADSFAGAVIDLFRSADRRRQLAAQGRAYVRSHFDWEHGAAQLEACLENTHAARTLRTPC
jgi:glycosyltransferase involved in cell wall biosynthesis